ncbi:MAG: hypothetical protein K0S44_213 [Bacteroidetes bacterium]|jgi:hypothetical protein|nr:hypothetical protein [Bacteroidota bacterium]
MSFDVAVIETLNGGDVQIKGSDLALVFGLENMIYLAMFGGNVEQSTEAEVPVQSFDWWGNRLLFRDTPSAQFNSETERTLNNTPLTSAGRVTIENAIKKDLEFLEDFGATVEVKVSIVATDRINVSIRVVFEAKGEKIIIINFKKKADGDFFIADFNNDFYL